VNSDDSPLGFLISLLIFLILVSAYFSGSETSMMTLNRYRLRHLARQKHPGALKTYKLLKNPDRLIGLILIGNNFVNLLAAAIASLIAIEIFGNPEPILQTVVLTFLILIFAEVTPKTIAALYPEKIAYPSSYVLTVLLKISYPLVWLVNKISNSLIRLLGFNPDNTDHHQLSSEELRTVVDEAGTLLPTQRQGMLLNILDLEKVTVNDILVPRNDIIGIDIEDDIGVILEQLASSQHTRMPVYKRDIDNVIGVLHLRNVGKFLKMDNLNIAAIIQESSEPYYIPESTPLHTQLINFQKHKRRMAVVVDEYGAVIGIVTLEDILEEIVGEFTTDLAASSRDIHPQEDGSFFIDGSASIREINRALGWKLDTSTAKTLNGLLMEHLESIPDVAVGVNLGGYKAEILQIKDKMIKTVKIQPPDNVAKDEELG